VNQLSAIESHERVGHSPAAHTLDGLAMAQRPKKRNVAARVEIAHLRSSLD
jgi:hypothetical protein